MTYAITLIKCSVEERKNAIDYLINLKMDKVKLPYDIEIVECYISFGWPDLVLILYGPNVELIKSAIIELRDQVLAKGYGILETSTLICTTPEEMTNAQNRIKEFGKRGN